MPHAATARSSIARVLLLTIIATLASTDLARAGTYPMRSCNVPGHRSASTGPWQWQAIPNAAATNHCAGGGGFGFALPGSHELQRETAAVVNLTRPSQGAQRVIAIRRARLWMIARLSGHGSALYAVAQSIAANGAVQQTGIFGPPGGDAVASPYLSPVLAQDTASFGVLLVCSGSTSGSCHADATHPLEIRGTEITLEESVPPDAAIVGGALTAPGSQSGVRAVSYSVVDHESGVAKVEVMLGDVVVAGRDLSGDPSQCSYSDFAACQPTRNEDLAVDTRAVADGTHPLALRVTDAAGNRRLVQAAAPVTVANGSAAGASAAARGAANGEGASDAAKLTVRFSSTKRAALTVPYGRRVTIRGRLTDAAGKPIKNARIQVRERPATTGSRVLDKGGARTRADGSFRYTVAKTASSRSLRVAYLSHLGDAKAVATKTLTLRVRASVSLKVGLRGISVSYSGRLLSKPVPRRGKLLFIQGRATGGAWQTFATRRTSRTGRFSGRYRLRVRRPGVRLQFRVRVPAEAGYPFSSRIGRSVTRRVR